MDENETPERSALSVIHPSSVPYAVRLRDSHSDRSIGTLRGGPSRHAGSQCSPGGVGWGTGAQTADEGGMLFLLMIGLIAVEHYRAAVRARTVSSSFAA